MTAGELTDLIVRNLARSSGGGVAGWRRAVGRLEVYERATHAHCNWEVRAAGTPREIDMVERAADAFRQSHPFVTDVD